MNLVHRHRSGGEIWQGGINDVGLLLSGPPGKIRTIGLFAQEHQSVRDQPGYELFRHGYDDVSIMSGPELERVKKIADRTSDRFADRLRAGRSVLSSCAMGYNRSGLVTALTLIKLGMGPDEAIKSIRDARGPWALSNPLFVDIVYGKADRRGEKGTWTRWVD